MEAKLKDSLAAKDYYSAHQQYIALAQRHCRSRRFDEAKQTLKEGCVCLAEKGEGRSAVDLGKRLVEVLQQGRKPLVDTDAIAVHGCLLAICKPEEEWEYHGVIDSLLKNNPELALVIFDALLKQRAFKEAALVALKLEGNEQEFKELGLVVKDPQTIVVITLSCLKQRSFNSCKIFLETLSSGHQKVEEAVAEDSDLGKSLNFCQLMYQSLQKRIISSANVPSQSVPKLLGHYGGLLARIRIKEEDIRGLEGSYIHQQQVESSGGSSRNDALSNLFQSIMQNQGQQPQRKK